MFKQILSSKIHGATVTDAKIDYVASISIDADLLKGANIVPNEKILQMDPGLKAMLSRGARAPEKFVLMVEPLSMVNRGIRLLL
jgi:hypothetical protein